MKLVWKDQYGFTCCQLVRNVIQRDSHFSVKHCNELKALMHMGGITEIFAGFTFQIFARTNVMQLIKHIHLRKQILSINYNIFGEKSQLVSAKIKMK